MPPGSREEIARYCSQMKSRAEDLGCFAYEVEQAYLQAENLLKTRYKKPRELAFDIQKMMLIVLEVIDQLIAM